jgi:hypothetical protein
MRTFISTSLLALSFTSFATTALAATPSNRPAANGYMSNWSWSGHLDHVNIDSEAAWLQGIDDGATALGFAAERYTNTSEMTLSLGASILFYNDNDEFAQYVRDSWGDVDYTESSANALMVFAEYGPKYRFGADNLSFFTVRGGASAILGSERSISNCSNCYAEDIEIDGGIYGVLGVGQTMGSLDWSLQFQQYFSGDLDNVIRLKLSGAF